MTIAYTWKEMIDDFCQLGGKAENIQQKIGIYGNGIFPIDPDKPVVIEVPPQLLIDVNHFALDGEALIIKADAAVPADIKEFIRKYQKSFSWGKEGKNRIEKFERGIAELPASTLEQLKKLRMVDLRNRHAGVWSEVLLRRFLLSRRISFNEATVIMPIVELINHSPRSPGYQINKTIKVSGKFKNEVTVNYSPFSDSMTRFLIYGFASPEPIAYSLPMKVKVLDKNIEIGHEFRKLDKKDGISLPVHEYKDAQLKCSHLMLASVKTPRVMKTVFRKMLVEEPVETADELFEFIRNINHVELYNLLDTLGGDESEVAEEFRKAIMFQLRGLTNCFGARKNPEI
jgi:hypothetical protein